MPSDAEIKKSKTMHSEAELKKSKTSVHPIKSQASMKSTTDHFGSKSMSRVKVRRASYGYGAVPGIRPVERTSQVSYKPWLQVNVGY